LSARVYAGVCEDVADYACVTEWFAAGLMVTGRTIQLRGEHIGKGEALVEPRSVLFSYGAKGPADATARMREQRVSLMWSKLPLSRSLRRPWFQCPKCYRRCEILYMVDATYACRLCQRLTYASTRERPGFRKALVAWQIRARLGAGADDGPEFPPKPKWMRWPTYRRWKHKEEEAIRAALSHRPRRPRSAKWLDPVYRRPLSP
jgi:hypothetical protein